MSKLHNPIIPGFYPDPSICRVDDDYYIVCSSFELSPAVPVFHSKDLVNWEQICYAFTPDNGFHMEKNCMNGGIMAPTIRYHEGTFYIMNMNYSDAGNYIITATDPAGPWSKPHWLTDVPGIDASLFFDDDGQCYVIGTAQCWPKEGGGIRQGVWVAKYDIENFKVVGETVPIFGGAFAGAASPEAPHLYHIGEYYYLMIAEGGTEHYHSETIARSKDVFGPYENNPANPLITHRHMGFRCPIGNVGHADLVELPDGSWYAVMLASRLIDGVSKNLGRETFICPVVWERGWPLFSPETGKLEWEYDAPACLPEHPFAAKPATDDFSSENLNLDWSVWGTPYVKFHEIADSQLTIRCIHQKLIEPLRQMGTESADSRIYFAPFLCQRQIQPNETIATRMHFAPRGSESAGLATVQAMNHQIHFQLANVDGVKKLQLLQFTADYYLPPYIPGFSAETHRTVLAETEWTGESVVLQLKLEGNRYTASYGADEDSLTVLGVADALNVNPEKVGCMVGTMLGVFATGNGEDVDNAAKFDYFTHTQD